MHLKLTSKLLIIMLIFANNMFAQKNVKEPGQIIWQETFDQSIWANTVDNGQTVIANLPEKWTFTDLTENNFYWQWSNQGPRGRHTSPNGGSVPKVELTPATPINSTTEANGFLMLPSDWYNTNDDGSSTSPSTPINSFVEYGPIDISDFQQVHFKIECFFKLLKPTNSEISIGFRDNNNNSVTVALDFQENIPSKNATVLDFNLTVLLELNEINKEQVFFRINQTGTSHYFFMIDDIKFYQPLDRNMRILDTWSDYHLQGGINTEIELHKDYFGGYKNIPLSIADTFVQFRTQAQNFGGITRQNIYVQTMIQNLHVNLINPVYNNISSTQNLEPSEESIFINTASFKPKLPGKYKITTTVTDGIAEDSNLNVIQSEINITNGLYSFIDTSSTSSFVALQADTTTSNYGYGQVFWVSDILTHKLVFNNLAFFIHPNQNANHLAAQEIEVQGYLFKKQGTNYVIVQTTETYKPVASDRGKFVNLQFVNPQELGGNQNYYLVLKVSNQSLSRKLMLAHDPNHHQSHGRSGIIMGSSNNLIIIEKTPVFYTSITGGYIPEETDILAFNIDGQIDNTVIDNENKTISLTMPYNANLTSLIPNFVLSINAVAKIGADEQISGTSVVNFASPVVYTIENGANQSEWTVTINLQPEPPAIFESFTIQGQFAQTEINIENRTIELSMPPGTSVTELIPEFTVTEGATVYVNEIEQVSGNTANDFSESVIYTLTSQGVISEEWTVTVDVLSEMPAVFLTFTIENQVGQTEINTENKTISLTMPYATNVAALKPVFTITEGATVYVGSTLQISGNTTNNFSSPVTYRLVSQGGVSGNWIVTVNVQPDLQTNCDILVFGFSGQTQQAIIDKPTINVNLPSNASINSLIPIFILSNGAKAYHLQGNTETPLSSGENIIDFTSEVTFRVRAENIITYIDWKIRVTTNQNSQADFESFEVHLKYIQDTVERDTIFYATIYNSNNKLELRLPQGTNLDSIKPIWAVSPGAIVKIEDSIQTSGESFINLSKPVEFNVISQQSQKKKNIKLWTLHTSYLVGIQEHNIYKYVKIYPNPAYNSLNIELPEDMRNGIYHIYNIYGQTVDIDNYRGTYININIQDQPKGIYFIRVNSGRYQTIEKILIK